MVDAARARKLADRIQQIVAEMLERRIKDPRLGFVTITDAKVTNDLRDATVYYTVYGSEGERADTAAALESAKGIIRSEVGRQTGIRHTPSIAFVLDEVMENASRIDDLLARARAQDEQVARAAERATPAGDANPYRSGQVGLEDGESDSDTEGEAGHSTP
jgi:ribosome-binding factor A